LVTQGMLLKRWVSIGALLSHLGLSLEDDLEKLLSKIKEVIDDKGVRNRS